MNKQVKASVWIFLMHDIAGIGSALHLRLQGIDVRKEDARRLKPFLRKHINFLGRYNFSISESIQNGSLRSLYVPESPLEKELD